MVSGIAKSGRWIALPLIGMQLLLSGAAVPHCHELGVMAGRQQTADHPHRHGPAHRHWAWSGHSHAGDQSDDRAAAVPFVPVDHDGDAVYLADACLAGEAERFDLVPRGAIAWLALPPSAPFRAVAVERPGRAVRPPGERPTLPDLLPHVLRV